MPSLFEKLILSSPRTMDFVFTRSPSKVARKKGEKKALATFKTASETVPAYKDFLKKNKVNPQAVETFADFKKLVPVMDKANYLDRYSLDKLCLGGTLADKFTLDRSSGYHGKSYYWPAFRGQRNATSAYLEYLGYKYGWFARDKKTLVIINMGLGLWVAGTLCVVAYRQIANRGRFPISVVSPGVDISATIDLIKKLGGYYDNLVFVAYPPLAKAVFEEGAKAGIDWKKLNVSLLAGGEGHSESWRDYIADLLGFRISGRNLDRIISVFGASDIGGIGGYETALAIKIRRLAREDPALAEDLFGRGDRLPQLFQYSPATVFIETVDNEIVFTKLAGIPIIRYNIHDLGGTILFEEAIKILRDHNYNIKELMEKEGYSEKEHLPLDFNFVFGRSDGTATIYGANIFVENIKEAIAGGELGKLLSGAFFMETKFTKKQDQYLSITVETSPGVSPSADLEKRVQRAVVELLREQNSEFRRLFETQGDKVAPKVTLTPKLESKTLKNKYT